MCFLGGFCTDWDNVAVVALFHGGSDGYDGCFQTLGFFESWGG